MSTKTICDGCGTDLTEKQNQIKKIEGQDFCPTCAAKVHKIVGDLTKVKNETVKKAETDYTADKARLIAEQCGGTGHQAAKEP